MAGPYAVLISRPASTTTRMPTPEIGLFDEPINPAM
ncbi:Uncharacterised protein [Mycobacterium tuberculosis]|uniref:Uncharacterized protein n=1 Tax=Mycobacterium tuberculosis TaxID=1773 RepID=A0A655JGG0_MYCTX|nr:Uncharacterised protein [Mycobacterium tuberculosis]CKU25520.1 Uncharacterised protein [Mycobacterium tuberculosis]COW89293.1 Uncharacterised protein [Mycobacterium tuberculosis]COX73841.1 Uncharacterised protein [Mycobacterium tuberculosis]